jgi:Ca2+-binding EF-hand superfamily protein
MDDDKNKKLCFDEFKKGINEYGLGLGRDDVLTLFQAFDVDKSGSVDFDEFLLKLRVSFF